MLNVKPSLTTVPQPRLAELKSSGQQVTPQAGQGESSRALSTLQERILGTLAQQIPGMSVEGMRKLDANDFTPEKVADRISGFVAAGLENARARGASEERIQELYNAAVKGVEKGFKEAKEILSNLNLLQGKIAEDVDETERRTFDALAQLSPNQSIVKNLSQLSVAERYARADSFELNVTTKAGDQIKIRFAQAQSFEASAAVSRDDKGNTRAQFDISRSEASGFMFEVQGNLNSDELDAIQNLIRDVSLLADEFFHGDVQKAFAQAGKLELDGSQLASMSLTMTRTESWSMAQAYQQTQQLDDAGSKPGRRLGQLMQGLSEQVNAQRLAFLEQPKAFGKQLMEALVEQDVRFKEALESQQNRYTENLGRLLQSLDQ